MTNNTLDQELSAIKTIAEALEPLDEETRARALSYAIQRLGIKRPELVQMGGLDPRVTQSPADHPAQSPDGGSRIVDMRTLKEQKRPSSDVEMATLVAYYLKHEAQEGERKDEIGTEDIEKYFVQAGYPLPAEKRFALSNAKNAGYLESAGRGRYKLNSVGHNLVAHGMPRSDSDGTLRARRRGSAASKRKSKKKTAGKKATATKGVRKKGKTSAQ